MTTLDCGSRGLKISTAAISFACVADGIYGHCHKNRFRNRQGAAIRGICTVAKKSKKTIPPVCLY